MNEKYLPIGSVCTLRGKNKKIMITGYYSVEFNGNLKINDYLGCAYPEGLLLPESACTFNHSDIEKIDFIGFKNDDQLRFNNLLSNLTGNDNISDSDDWVLASNESYSKLLFDENGVVVLAEPVATEKTTNKIRFDENGVVISEEQEKVENPFYYDYSSLKQDVSNPSPEQIFSNYKFDENGTVVGVDESFDEKKESMLNKIEFDENGVVISAGEQPSVPMTRYQFDENGVLIAINDGTETSSQSEEQILQEDLNTEVSDDIEINEEESNDENIEVISEEEDGILETEEEVVEDSKEENSGDNEFLEIDETLNTDKLDSDLNN